MNRTELTELLSSHLGSRIQSILDEEKKMVKKKKPEEPYVEDADDPEHTEKTEEKKKKMKKDAGAYKSLSSTGVKDSVVAEDMIEESKTGVGQFSLKKTGTDTDDGNPDQYEPDVTTTYYDIFHRGKRVGELSYDDYFGYIRGNLYGKDLPELSGYGRNKYESRPLSNLHGFLKSKTGQRWASTGKLRGRDLLNENVEETLEEANINAKIKKEIDALRKKKKSDIDILMDIDRKYGSDLSEKEMEGIAVYLSEAYNDRVYYDDSTSKWALDSSAINHALKMGYPLSALVGILSVKGSRSSSDMHLFKLSREDQSLDGISRYTSRPGLDVFRFTTANTAAGGLMPLVLVNFDRNLVYFNKQEASDEGRVEFETRGVPLEYARFVNAPY